MTVESYCFKYFQRSAIIHELLLVSVTLPAFPTSLIITDIIYTTKNYKVTR